MRWLRVFCLLGLSLSVWARPPHAWELPITPQSHDNWLFDVQPVVPPPPEQFGILRVGGLPCRIPSDRLPWRIHPGDSSRNHLLLLDRAIILWNRTGLDLGLGYLFQRSDDPAACDLILRWYDPQLPRDKAAATWWSNGSGQKRVLGLSVDGNFNVPEGNLAQILSHELGHILGLGESFQRGDMMYYLMDNRRLGLDQVQLSLRDKLAVRWLYQQRNFIPIRGRLD